DFRFIGVNGPTGLSTALEDVGAEMLNSEVSYGNRFIIVATLLPIVTISVIVLYIPVLLWICYDQKKAFKMLTLVKKSVPTALYKQCSKDNEEYDVRNLIQRSSISKLFVSKLTVITLLGILVAAFSIIGGVANVFYLPYMKQVSAIGNIIRLS